MLSSWHESCKLLCCKHLVDLMIQDHIRQLDGFIGPAAHFLAVSVRTANTEDQISHSSISCLGTQGLDDLSLCLPSLLDQDIQLQFEIPQRQAQPFPWLTKLCLAHQGGPSDPAWPDAGQLKEWTSTFGSHADS